MQLSDDKPTQDAILEVWHMAHDLKAVIEQQGKAQIQGRSIVYTKDNS